jgi:hypothetical protein
MSVRREVEVVAESGALVVLRMEPRRFPGVLLGGDTLYTWLETVNEACDSVGPDPALTELRESIEQFLWSYVDALVAAREPLPFELAADDLPRRTSD